MELCGEERRGEERREDSLYNLLAYGNRDDASTDWNSCCKEKSRKVRDANVITHGGPLMFAAGICASVAADGEDSSYRFTNLAISLMPTTT